MADGPGLSSWFLSLLWIILISPLHFPGTVQGLWFDSSLPRRIKFYEDPHIFRTAYNNGSVEQKRNGVEHPSRRRKVVSDFTR